MLSARAVVGEHKPAAPEATKAVAQDAFSVVAEVVVEVWTSVVIETVFASGSVAVEENCGVESVVNSIGVLDPSGVNAFAGGVCNVGAAAGFGFRLYVTVMDGRLLVAFDDSNCFHPNESVSLAVTA